MTEMVTTHNKQLKKIQSFDRLSNILCGQLWLYSVANIVNSMSIAIPIETSAAYKEARIISKVVEGAAMKAEFLDGIVFLNWKMNPMTESPNESDNLPEDIIYLKMICNLHWPDIDERIVQDPFEI